MPGFKVFYWHHAFNIPDGANEDYVLDVDPEKQEVKCASGYWLFSKSHVQVLAPYNTMKMIQVRDYTLVNAPPPMYVRRMHDKPKEMLKLTLRNSVDVLKRKFPFFRRLIQDY